MSAGAELEPENVVAGSPHFDPPLVDFAGGVFAGCLQVLVGHPADTVKVRMQTIPAAKVAGPIQTFLSILRGPAGVVGLYRGATAALPGLVLEGILMFGVYSTVRPVLPFAKDDLRGVAAAGACAGFCSAHLMGPSELVKTQLQVQGARIAGVLHRAPSDVLLQILRTEGVRGVFRGLTATLMRDCPGGAVYFASNEAAMRVLSPPGTPVAKTAIDSAKHVAAVVACGGIAGVSYWSAVLPFDVIKSRMQAESIGSPRVTAAATARAIFREGGVRGFYAGFLPVVARAFPANAAAFCGVAGVRALYEAYAGTKP